MYYVPDAAKAVPYNQIYLQPDHVEACGHYLAKKWGTKFVLTFPHLPRKLWNLVLSGFVEAQALEHFIAGWSFPTPIPETED